MWLRLRVIQINWLYPSGGGWFPQLLTDRASLFALDSPADYTGRRQKELSNTGKINSDYKERGNTKDTVRLITLWHLNQLLFNSIWWAINFYFLMVKFRLFDLKLFFVLVSLFYSSQETFTQNWILKNIVREILSYSLMFITEKFINFIKIITCTIFGVFYNLQENNIFVFM